MNQQLDTNDKCPSCQKDWDGGDIRQVIGNLDIHQFTDSKKLDALAGEFGWTPENNKRFSKTKTYQMKPEVDAAHIYAECNHCGSIFRLSDSENIGRILDLRALYNEKDQEE